MKYKDVLIVVFLSGLLLYAACHRAGFLESFSDQQSLTGNTVFEKSAASSLQFENWVFIAHPDNGLTVSTESGEVLHHIPHFTSTEIEVTSEPDTTGQSLGLLIVTGEKEDERPSFRIRQDGVLERTDS